MNPVIEKYPTFEDHRGSFTPLVLNRKPDVSIVWDQVNISVNTKKGTFRGMHYQINSPQQKYVKVVQGKIIDFLYDLNTKEVLIYEMTNQEALFVSKNYAHGFLTLEDYTIVSYLTEGAYEPTKEKCISFTGVDEIRKYVYSKFNEEEITISEKDS
jgi:dTDP-4-dehydrorhamnose 3,5-epimerase-like enzyme